MRRTVTALVAALIGFGIVLPATATGSTASTQATCKEGDRNSSVAIGNESMKEVFGEKVVTEGEKPARVNLRYSAPSNCVWAIVDGEPGVKAWLVRESRPDEKLVEREVQKGNANSFTAPLNLQGSRIKACASGLKKRAVKHWFDEWVDSPAKCTEWYAGESTTPPPRPAIAGPTAPSGTSTSSKPVGDVSSDSTNVACAAGTRDLGTTKGYRAGEPVPIRLCAVTGFRSSGEESNSKSPYYVKDALGDAVVNSRVSGAVQSIFSAMRASGVPATATSSFRTQSHQTDLCMKDAGCRKGNYSLVGRPGTSNHQMGLAIDFEGPTARGGNACTSRAASPSNPTWAWLKKNAASFGYRQYAKESWHWDPTSKSNMC